MYKKLLSILVLSVVAASTLVGCDSSPSTLTVFSVTEGEVLVMKAGTNSWIEAEAGMSLEVGDRIKTADDSSAEIAFFDGSTMELEAGTELEIASLDVSGDTGRITIILEQTIGSIIFRVTKIVDPASLYEVETPAGVVAVRGSAVQVYVIEDGTTYVTNLEGDIRAIAQGVELQVPEGWKCIIRLDEPPVLEVTFADPNLEAAVREAIGKPAGPIYASDLDGLTSLDAAARSITDLGGLEYATSLTVLYLMYNQIVDVSPLANLTSLAELYLDDNQISDISPLAALTNLTRLWLPGNQISDFSIVATLTGLTWLNLENTQISDISILTTLTGLTWVDLGVNQIGDITPLANLISLTTIDLGGNQISDISPLVQNQGLGTGDVIDLSVNPLSADSLEILIPELQERGVTVAY